MQLHRRPAQPQQFPKSWETTKQKAERLIEARLNKSEPQLPADSPKPKRGAGRKPASEVKVFPELWKTYKALFAYAQFEKCGFCESSILATSHGDVEHYRPKSQISKLEEDEATGGRQQEASAATRGRKVTMISPTGYYWLAYEWSNYLLACSICNSSFKGTIFPVKDDPRPVPPLKTHPSENALLLNPFDNKDPAKHLRFLPDGFVLPKSAHGRATIETCGLYRLPLVTRREQIARRVYELAEDLRRSSRKRKNPYAVRDCYERGTDEAEYSGMVRCILHEVGGMSWEQLVKKRATELALEIKSTRSAQKRKELDADMERMGRSRYEHSAMVRRIFEKTTGVKWDKLVSRRMNQMAADFLAAKRDWSRNQDYELNMKKNLYLMARDNPTQVSEMEQAYKKVCRMDWADLKTMVESRFEFLWRLP